MDETKTLESEIRDDLRAMGFDFEQTPDGYTLYSITDADETWGSGLTLADLLEFIRDFADSND